jgi:hypothetical protein
MRGRVPIGQLRFMLPVEPQVRTQPAEAMGEQAKLFRRAFLSYSSEDRVEVLKRAQALKAAGVVVFQDLMSLEAGEAWEERLNAEIDACDLFLLFWSEAARRSDWVAREVDRALERRARTRNAEPEIMPVILEGPPPPAPPQRFAHLHFNDPVCYLIAAHRP